MGASRAARMRAPLCVGRVGGLAAALGVGTVLFFGSAGVAAADVDDSGRGGETAAASPSPRSESRSTGRGRENSAPGDAGSRVQREPLSRAVSGSASERRTRDDAQPPASVVDGLEQLPDASMPAEPEPEIVAPRPDPAPVPVQPEVPSRALPAAAELVEEAPAAPSVAAAASVVGAPAAEEAPLVSTEPSSDAPFGDAPTPPVPVPVAPTATVSSFSIDAAEPTKNGAGIDPLLPADSPLAWALLAASRREIGTAAAADISGAATQQTASAVTTPFSEKGITADPKVVLDKGGNFIALVNATTTRDDVELVFSGMGGSKGGKVTTGVLFNPETGKIDQQSAALLPYATWLDGNAKSTETFRVSIREYTAFDAFFADIPIISDIVFKPIIHFLQDTPLISTLLAPIIGSSVVVPIDVDVAALGGDKTLAFTYKVTSFDGTEISTNFFPSETIETTGTAPTVMIGSGFGYAGQTAPYALYALKDEVPGVYALRSTGYNVITYDPRGRFDSGGEVHMANPEYEGRDVFALITWLTEKTPAALNAPGDPKVGLVGGSYGAALQFAAAGDTRIDAMVPVDGWDTLLGSFYPAETFRTAYGALTILSLLRTGSRVYPPLYWAFGTGMVANWVGPLSQNLLKQSDPVLTRLTTPTLMIRGIVDVLFPLQQGTASAETIVANGVPFKMQWICTGHGKCNDPYGPAQTQSMAEATAGWLKQYVKQEGPVGLPNFLWFDQKGKGFFSNYLPFQEGFNDLPDVVVEDDGGLLPLVPFVGGSGEWSLEGIVNGTDAWNSVKIDVPTETLKTGTQVVGTPTVSFTYRGLGIGGAVYAQVVNKTTGLVLGNVVMPVPVTLNGMEHTVSADIGEIAYTVGEGDQLEVQLAGFATAFFNVPLGLINISDVTVTMPNRTAPPPFNP